MIPILLTLWLLLGLRAAYLAHTGLQRNLDDQDLGGYQPLGGTWVVWGPFLIGLVALGPVALICVCALDRGEKT